MEEHGLRIDQSVSQSARQALSIGSEEEPCSDASVALKNSLPLDNLQSQNTKNVFYGYSSAVMESRRTPGILAKRHFSFISS